MSLFQLFNRKFATPYVILIKKYSDTIIIAIEYFVINSSYFLINIVFNCLYYSAKY